MNNFADSIKPIGISRPISVNELGTGWNSEEEDIHLPSFLKS